MKKNNISIDLAPSESKFYEWSKNNGDGFTQLDNGKGYRKYHDEIVGRLNSIEIRKSNFGGNEVVVALDGEGNNNRYFVKFPIKYPKGGVNDYTKYLVCYLGNMNKGGLYKLSLFNFIPEDKDRAIKGLTVYKEAGSILGEEWEKLERFLQTTDLPKWELIKEEIEEFDEKGNLVTVTKNTWDKKKHDDFLLKTLNNEYQRLKFVKGESVKTTSEKVVEKKVDFPDDDLPF